MKTTVEIPDALLEQLRRRAGREKTTLRALIHAALRQFLGARTKGNGKFKLKDGSVRGEGLAAGVREGDWDQIRSMAYEGRGG
ncbi:MAG: type II toxin-antitoxin system VapB family antitoxin [Phycisphaerales bacterium]